MQSHDQVLDDFSIIEKTYIMFTICSKLCGIYVHVHIVVVQNTNETTLRLLVHMGGGGDSLEQIKWFQTADLLTGHL